MVPDRTGAVADVVLGYESLETMKNGAANFASVVGRYANRIANGRFELDGKTYELPLNNGPNHLHGGPDGLWKQLFTAEPLPGTDRVGVVMTHVSPDGHMGYPGNLTVTVTYTLHADNSFHMQFAATTDAATVVNLCSHAYWNLAGHNSGNILQHLLTLHADAVTSVNENMIPTGEFQPVDDTAYDFRQATPIGARIQAFAEDHKTGHGYDINYVVRRQQSQELVPVARLEDPVSGRVMEVLTSEPGIQLYTANWLNIVGKQGTAYGQYQGVCLETQRFPNSPNTPHFPSAVLRPGQEYVHDVIHKFSW
eukprot:TRINITY_DN1994_c0_g1_i3.p1 TRINITY_DN1994_c0_g1~~TRINITY_DN1994_c0_g1_i3.p1  ORF type:complete len:309 (-),score=89.54 TRINITY_DN1994_c0_g1_i3:66-992(-)